MPRLQGHAREADSSAVHIGFSSTRAGWSSKNNHLLIGEALSYEFENKVLNPFGVEIDLPYWVFKRVGGELLN
jgi:hypothetical protein